MLRARFEEELFGEKEKREARTRLVVEMVVEEKDERRRGREAERRIVVFFLATKRSRMQLNVEKMRGGEKWEREISQTTRLEPQQEKTRRDSQLEVDGEGTLCSTSPTPFQPSVGLEDPSFLFFGAIDPPSYNLF